MSVAQFARHSAFVWSGLEPPPFIAPPSAAKRALAEVLRAVRNSERDLRQIAAAFKQQGLLDDVDRVRDAIEAHRASRAALTKALRR
jgi:hypothetical protein